METFALRVHFMLWGTFAATVKRPFGNRRLQAERPAAARAQFSERRNYDLGGVGQIRRRCGREDGYDFAANVMADEWDARAALAKVRTFPRAEIADVLLDQAIFAGVGNIIKNEVLFRTRVSPSPE
jgi:endonuclease-8